MEYSIRPAPGTCCPEMKIVDGVCQGCGRKFICDICGKQLKTRAGLRAHERMKHGVWRYKQ
jgi:hypothetical protein